MTWKQPYLVKISNQILLFLWLYSLFAGHMLKITRRTTGARGYKFELFWCILYWTIFSYLISVYILVNLGASWCISVYLSLYQFRSLYLNQFRSILIFLGLSCSIPFYFSLFWTFLVYLGLSWSISVILVYLCLSQSISVYLGLSWFIS